MRHVSIFLLLFFAYPLTGWTQSRGSVEVDFEPGIQGVLGGYVSRATEDKPGGFRVQICTESGNNARSLANQTKSQYYQKYDGKKAYLIWESPNFKVRVGDFKNRLEATLYWKQIVEDFPASYVVMDEIKLFKSYE